MNLKRIIIADDSATARKFILKCLEIVGIKEGVELVEVINGKEALTTARQQPADLIITDLNMDVMNGDHLVRWLKATPVLERIPVIVITSAGNDAKKEELKKLGVVDVLDKPINPMVLNEAISKLSEGKKTDWDD